MTKRNYWLDLFNGTSWNELKTAGDRLLPVTDVENQPVIFLPTGSHTVRGEFAGPIPARLDDDDRLRLQVRPGHWVVEVTARSAGTLSAIPVPRTSGSWPPEEVWAFEARANLRLVEPGGLPSVDPRQTSLPLEWRELPAFLQGIEHLIGKMLVRLGLFQLG